MGGKPTFQWIGEDGLVNLEQEIASLHEPKSEPVIVASSPSNPKDTPHLF